MLYEVITQEEFARVLGAHAEQLDLPTFALHIHNRSAPIHLRLDRRLWIPGDEGPWAVQTKLSLEIAHYTPDVGLTPIKPMLGSKAVVDPSGRVALLPGRFLVVFQPLHYHSDVRPQLRIWLRFPLLVLHGLVVKHLAYNLTAMAGDQADFSDALLVHSVHRPDRFVLFHAEQLLSSSGPGSGPAEESTQVVNFWVITTLSSGQLLD